MAAKKPEQHAVAPVLRVAPLGELKVYTVTEDELDTIGRGSPGSIFLNFALALLPLAGGFFITILSTKIETIGTLVFFISACIICFLGGVLCAFLAWHYHASTSAVIAKIKDRMPPPEPIVQSTVEVGSAADKATVTKEASGPSTSSLAPPSSSQPAPVPPKTV